MQDPIMKYLKGNYWKGEPERHSEAAKLGWELRRFGWSRVTSTERLRKTNPLSSTAYEIKKRHITIYESKNKNIIHETLPDKRKIKLEYTPIVEISQRSHGASSYNKRGDRGPGWYISFFNTSHPGHSKSGMYKQHGPYKTEKDAKKALLPIIIIE